MRIIDSLKLNLPFAYMWLLKKSIGDAKTILDLGCGDGSLMELLSKGENWQITGIDIYQKSIDMAGKKKIYSKLIIGDLLSTLTNKKLNFQYDVVFFSQVLEHISKKRGEKILNIIEKFAKKRIVVGTPRGFMEQPHEFLDGNPYQVHRSGWNIEDFTQRGYKIYGVGFWPIWSYHGWGRNASSFKLIIANIISYLMSPFVYFFPTMAAGVIAIKEKRKKNA